jgi:hypothetical protein
VEGIPILLLVTLHPNVLLPLAFGLQQQAVNYAQSMEGHSKVGGFMIGVQYLYPGPLDVYWHMVAPMIGKAGVYWMCGMYIFCIGRRESASLTDAPAVYLTLAS